MKHLLASLSCLLLLSLFTTAQEKPLSPPKTAAGEIGDVKIEVNYCAPSVRDREVWGELVPYNEVWRTGANEATTINFTGPVIIDGQELAAGKYALFTIPGEEGWTVIFNKNYKQWGAYKYDESKDALRISVQPQAVDHHEQLGIDVTEAAIAIEWEKLRVVVPVSAG